MGHDQSISKGGNAGIAGAKSDESAIREDGINDAHDLPRYSETEPSTYQKEINTQQLTIPQELGDEARLVSSAQDITTDFFTAIREGNHALISSLLSTGLATVSTTTRDGLTPLLAAIETGPHRNSATTPRARRRCKRVRCDRAGPEDLAGHAPRIQRTPLQLAAARGNLPIPPPAPTARS
ncbi:hypothetical protein NUW58_g27 [Xylaria curta]|uniref:Uncharacterized protein n=1 Tax=Xylaria curta TaxID=42375 RepID=A0ACC1PU13_9PEZI|nr:hypothetical protein NUW58_g27 [Xylaria curta]